MGYVISRPALAAIGPHVEQCRRQAVSDHSDTELGRCVHQFARVQCRGVVPAHKIRPLFASRKNGEVFPMVLQGGRIRIPFPKTPSEFDFRAALIHPLKQPEEFYLFHKQCIKRLRPPQQPLITTGIPSELSKYYNAANNELRATCVNNPNYQIYKYGTAMHACPPSFALEESHTPDVVHIIPSPAAWDALSTEDVQTRLLGLKTTLL